MSKLDDDIRVALVAELVKALDENRYGRPLVAAMQLCAQLADELDEPALATRLRRAAYAIRRRLDVWQRILPPEQLAEVAKATGDAKPIIFLGWEPHPMNANFKMTYLTGGDDYFGPNLGGAVVDTNVRAGYVAECPNTGKLLQNLVFSLPMENEIMGAILNEVTFEQAIQDAMSAGHWRLFHSLLSFALNTKMLEPREVAGGMAFRSQRTTIG